jgi:hypothetical protein
MNEEEKKEKKRPMLITAKGWKSQSLKLIEDGILNITLNNETIRVFGIFKFGKF